MAIFLLCFLAFIAAGLYIAGQPYVKAWICRRPREPYDPRSADPLEAAFADARRIVSGRLTTAAVDELLGSFDWHAAEYMVKSAPKERT